MLGAALCAHSEPHSRHGLHIQVPTKAVLALGDGHAFSCGHHATHRPRSPLNNPGCFGRRLRLCWAKRSLAASWLPPCAGVGRRGQPRPQLKGNKSEDLSKPVLLLLGAASRSAVCFLTLEGSGIFVLLLSGGVPGASVGEDAPESEGHSTPFGQVFTFTLLKADTRDRGSESSDNRADSRLNCPKCNGQISGDQGHNNAILSTLAKALWAQLPGSGNQNWWSQSLKSQRQRTLKPS